MSFQLAHVVGGRFDPPFMPTKTEPYLKGLQLETRTIETKRIAYTPSVDMELLACSVGASEYEARDYWCLYVEDRMVCDTIYTKDLPEGLYFTAIIPVPAGTKIEFEFRNEGGRPKFVWVNFQFLK